MPAHAALPGPGAAAFAGLDAYVAFMRRCWAQAPANRPTFADAVVVLGGLQDAC